MHGGRAVAWCCPRVRTGPSGLVGAAVLGLVLLKDPWGQPGIDRPGVPMGMSGWRQICGPGDGGEGQGLGPGRLQGPLAGSACWLGVPCEGDCEWGRPPGWFPEHPGGRGCPVSSRLAGSLRAGDAPGPGCPPPWPHRLRCRAQWSKLSLSCIKFSVFLCLSVCLSVCLSPTGSWNGPFQQP